MRAIRLMTAPIRGLVRSRVVQLVLVLAFILALDHYSFDYALLRQISAALKAMVDATVQFCAQHFRVGVLTDPLLQVTLIIAYVYVVCLAAIFLLRSAARTLADLIGRSNFLWLRNAIARERGIAAYRAWEPFERIRPAGIPQEEWERMFAWPADNKPPYPALPWRILTTVVGYLILIAVAIVLLQVFTPLPALSLIGRLLGLADR
jgi:hypothetical protein